MNAHFVLQVGSGPPHRVEGSAREAVLAFLNAAAALAAALPPDHRADLDYFPDSTEWDRYGWQINDPTPKFSLQANAVANGGARYVTRYGFDHPDPYGGCIRMEVLTSHAHALAWCEDRVARWRESTS